MSGAHEGCSQGKSVRDREGSKHSTAATLERVDSQAAVFPGGVLFFPESGVVFFHTHFCLHSCASVCIYVHFIVFSKH